MKVLRPVSYSKKCPYCRAVVIIENSEMNFKGPNSRPCPNCSHTVFFTDSYGQLDTGVLVEYGLVPETVKKQEERSLFDEEALV